jgi:hypothetical protein
MTLAKAELGVDTVSSVPVTWPFRNHVAALRLLGSHHFFPGAVEGRDPPTSSIVQQQVVPDDGSHQDTVPVFGTIHRDP